MGKPMFDFGFVSVTQYACGCQCGTVRNGDSGEVLEVSILSDCVNKAVVDEVLNEARDPAAIAIDMLFASLGVAAPGEVGQ